MRSFNLTVVSPEKTIFNGSVTYCCFVTPEGKMGVKANHEPFLVVLKDNAEFLYRPTDGSEETIYPVNATAVFKKNECTIILSGTVQNN
jgi:F0F1-type ATP synthase epsilon subunit